jgi:hypothetical protein
LFRLQHLFLLDFVLDLLNLLDVVLLSVNFLAAAIDDPTLVNFDLLTFSEFFVLVANHVQLVYVLFQLYAFGVEGVIITDDTELYKMAVLRAWLLGVKLIHLFCDDTR